jgi:glutathione S-transferase
VRLYQRWKCPWCAAARQALANVGVGCEIVEVPYPRKERTELVELTGQPRVPVLVDGDEVIVDSRRIVRHLYQRYGGAPYARSIAELDRQLQDAGGRDWCDLGTDLDEEGIQNLPPGQVPGVPGAS